MLAKVARTKLELWLILDDLICLYKEGQVGVRVASFEQDFLTFYK